MSRYVEVIQDGKNVGPLIDLWSSPNPEALRADWKIPDGVMMGLASQNQELIRE